ncbi:MAG: 5'-methylthioadenosine/S-adenosylhomocysteine nucleosidase [Acholeplasmataceae bacterium]|nr:5'-methylthioadenosine/S-adenosylhomocysteine nucleosidase [Acholeplasmataceae bacterium]
MILLVAAMDEEIREIKKSKFDNIEIILTGVGKVNAAMTLAQYLVNHQVEAIYNLGFSGATQPYEVGDLILVNSAMYHDFDLSLFGYEKGQVPGFPQAFVSDSYLLSQVKKKFPKIKEANLYTGDYFKTEHSSEPCVLDMEGAALYQVAYKNKIPMVSIKVVSDVMGMENHFQSYRKFEAKKGAELLNQVYNNLFNEVK